MALWFQKTHLVVFNTHIADLVLALLYITNPLQHVQFANERDCSWSVYLTFWLAMCLCMEMKPMKTLLSDPHQQWRGVYFLKRDAPPRNNSVSALVLPPSSPWVFRVRVSSVKFKAPVLRCRWLFLWVESFTEELCPRSALVTCVYTLILWSDTS